MSDPDTELTRRFTTSASAIDVTPPAWDGVVERAARQRRRRRRTLTVAGALSVACAIAGLVAVTARPSTNGPGGLPPSIASTAVTAAATASTKAAGPSVTLAVAATDPSPDAWSRLPDSPLEPRTEPLVVSTGSGVLVWGGYNPSQVLTDGAYYDAQQRTWRLVPPAPLASDRGDAIGVWTGTEVVVVNGVSGDVKSAAFNPTTMSWRALKDPPVDNAANASSRLAVVDGTIVLVSIFEDGAAPQNQVAQLDDLTSGHWSVLPAPPVALESPVDLVAGTDEVYLVGTIHLKPNECWAVHLLAYSPATKKWREIASNPIANRAETVTVWTGSEILFGGGSTCSNGIASGTPTNALNLYNPTTGKWRTGTPAPSGFWAGYRFPDTWTGTSAVGFAESGVLLLYNPATDRWHEGPILNAPNPISPFATPQALIGRSLVIAGGQITNGGEPCCDPFIGTYAYTIPDGF